MCWLLRLHGKHLTFWRTPLYRSCHTELLPNGEHQEIQPAQAMFVSRQSYFIAFPPAIWIWTGDNFLVYVFGLLDLSYRSLKCMSTHRVSSRS